MRHPCVLGVRLTAQSYFDGDVMRVTIESENAIHDHYVHKALLQVKSPYFAALPNFKEGENNHVVLKEMDSRAFKHIVHWLYTDRFSPSFQDSKFTIIRAYAAADHLMIPKCKNMVLDSLRVKYTTIRADVCDLAEVKKLGYGASSTIATCVTDQIVYEATTEMDWRMENLAPAFFEDGGDHASELVKKLVTTSRRYSLKENGKSLLKKQGYSDPALAKGCVYHDHAEGENCHLQGAQVTTA